MRRVTARDFNQPSMTRGPDEARIAAKRSR